MTLLSRLMRPKSLSDLDYEAVQVMPELRERAERIGAGRSKYANDKTTVRIVQDYDLRGALGEEAFDALLKARGISFERPLVYGRGDDADFIIGPEKVDVKTTGLMDGPSLCSANYPVRFYEHQTSKMLEKGIQTVVPVLLTPEYKLALVLGALPYSAVLKEALVENDEWGRKPHRVLRAKVFKGTLGKALLRWKSVKSVRGEGLPPDGNPGSASESYAPQAGR